MGTLYLLKSRYLTVFLMIGQIQLKKESNTMLAINKLLAKISLIIALILIALWVFTPLWHSAAFVVCDVVGLYNAIAPIESRRYL